MHKSPNEADYVWCGSCFMQGPKHESSSAARAAWNGLPRIVPMGDAPVFANKSFVNQVKADHRLAKRVRRLAKRVRELMGIDGLSRLGIRDQWSVGNFRVVKSPADLFPEKEE
jgi:hypothetical protein